MVARVDSVQKKTLKKFKKKKERDLRHPFEYSDFIKWVAMPTPFRTPEKQQELAGVFKVSEQTLSAWKKRKNFGKKVDAEMKKYFSKKTTNVIQALYNQILREGKASEVKLWLQYLKDWIPKEGIEHSDITLEDLIDEAKRARQQGVDREPSLDKKQKGDKPKTNSKSDSKALSEKKDTKGSDSKGKAEGI